jgi:hypothetical protein
MCNECLLKRLQRTFSLFKQEISSFLPTRRKILVLESSDTIESGSKQDPYLKHTARISILTRIQ